MKRYIARIKIDSKPIFSLICTGEKDYVISTPKSSKILNNGGYFNFHFTLHTLNNRVTQKITDFGNDEKTFNQILEEANKGDFYVSKDKEGVLKDIDMTKGKYYLMLENPGFIGNILTFGINDIHNDKKITDFFSESKKTDEIFSNMINIEYPKHLKDIEIQLNVCKNFILSDPLIAYKSKGIKYEKAFVIEDELHNDKYKFILLIKNNINKNETGS